MIDLNEFAGGAFAERMESAIMQAAQNIQDPNTEAKAARKISVTLTFKPNKSRTVADVAIQVTPKLAPAQMIETQFAMGRNARNGRIEVAEYDGQVIGQARMDFDGNTATAPGMDEQDADDQSNASAGPKMPIDLRARARGGYSYDPSTGEIYDTEKNA